MAHNSIPGFSKILMLFIFSFLTGCEIFNFGDDTKEWEDLMKIGIKLTANTPEPEKYFNDLIHPCVRYIPNGFGGHQWWMVATPFRGKDKSIENPILFYGDSRDGNRPPLNWEAWGVITETPEAGGFNSDPNLYYDGKGLWIFWRENFTESCSAENMVRATFGIYSSDGLTFSSKKYFAGESSLTEDSEMCPTVISYNGKINLYGVKHQFEPPRQALGLSIWEIEKNDLENNTFVKSKDVMPEYKKGFDLWHIDLFNYENYLFCVTSPEGADEILIGYSTDGENFKFCDKPLISLSNTGRHYFYKPTALILNGIFYLWYPIEEQGSVPSTNRIWMSAIDFKELIKKTGFEINAD